MCSRWMLQAPRVLVGIALAVGLAAGCAGQKGPAKAPPAPKAPAPAPSTQSLPPATGKMTKVVFRTVMPGMPADSPDAKPKTLYRLDNRYGRIEHPVDPKTGVEAVVIVASPDGWFVDRAKGTATHFVDPGPTFNFRAPIAPRRELPKSVAEGLEFGRELYFVEAHHPKVTRERSPKGVEAEVHEAEVEGAQVFVSTDVGTRNVRSVVVAKGNRILESFHYDEYKTDLPPDLSLFSPPPGVRIVEQQAAKKPVKKP